MQGVDTGFEDLYDTTVAASNVQLSAAAAFEQNLTLRHHDIEHTFVRSRLEEDVFIRLPPGCGSWYGKGVRVNRPL